MAARWVICPVVTEVTPDGVSRWPKISRMADPGRALKDDRVVALGRRLDRIEQRADAALGRLEQSLREIELRLLARAESRDRVADARLREAAEAVIAVIEDRIRLFRPPALRNASAHADADLAAGQPLLAGCGHLTTSFVTDRRTQETACLACHRARHG